MNFDQQYTHARATMEGGDWKLRAEIADLKAAAEQLAAALDEVVNDTEVYMPEDWWERARDALEAWKAAK